jgi:hypothetical protein
MVALAGGLGFVGHANADVLVNTPLSTACLGHSIDVGVFRQPGSTGSARDRRAIVSARRLFTRRCGFPTSSWQSLGAVALVSGVGFWDTAHGQTGHARNYSELHPVTGVRFVAGCA